MLLQKTGLRIKRFISHQSNKSLEDPIEDIPTPEKKRSGSIPRRLSWRLSRNSSFDFSSLQRTNSASTSKSRQLSSTNESASSSASSLCSCGCEAHAGSTGYSLSKSCPAPNPFDVLYLPPLSSSSITGDLKTWGLVFSDTPSSSRGPGVPKNRADPVTTDSATRLSTFDLLEALSIVPLDKDKTPTQSLRENEEIKMDTFMEDVDQLIKDTDGALKAVGTALADAKVATKLWHDITPTPTAPAVTRTTTLKRSPTIGRGVSRKAPRAQIFATKTATFRQTPSSSKGKGQKGINKSKRPTILGRSPRNIPATSPHASPKWHLTGANMVDVFGAIFRPVEVEEMLTPGRLQQIRHEHVLENKHRKSSESSRSTNTAASDTPSEPFHFEDLSARIDAANKRRTPSEPILPPPPVPFLDKTSPPNIKEHDNPHEAMRIDDLQFPIPPLQDPAPLNLTLRPQSQSRNRTNSPVILLPTIPELSPLHLSPTQFPYNSSEESRSPSPRSTSPPIHKPTPLPLNDKMNLNLASTLYTKTSPLFLQGAIRISHSILEARRLEKKYSPLHIMWEEAEPLDWTAFQMAILGNSLPEAADDEFSEDIMGWWEGFAIGGPGALVREWEQEEASPQQSLASSGILETEERFREVDGDAEELTEQYLVELQGLQVNTRYHELPHNGTIPSPPPRSQLRKLKPKAFDLEPSRVLSELGSMPDTPASLPPSPMFDLVVPAGVVEEKKDVRVPMGFNLGHDLGDYLSWETWNVPGDEEREDLYAI